LLVAEIVPDEYPYEYQLEDGLAAYLGGHFSQHPANPYRGEAKVIANTARGGPKTGKWSQPDLVLVSLRRLRIQRRIELDLFSFELKRCEDSDVDGVLEAVAHTRYAHYAFLAWHQPRNNSIRANKQRDVESMCRTHGIGLITFAEPSLGASYDILLAPERKSPHAADVEDFLANRLAPEDYKALQTEAQHLECSQ
jgi:hypothetical protein